MNATGENRAFLLTPAGTGAIALIRVEGPAAVDIASRVFRGPKGNEIPAGHWEIDRPRYGHIVDANHDVLDEVVVCLIRRTPEPAFEISCHGGVRVVERILTLLDACGATLAAGTDAPAAAWPVESLIEREIVDRMCAAKTGRAVHFLAAQRKLLTSEIRTLAAMLPSRLDEVTGGLNELLSGYSAAQLLLNGANVAIIGPPNSGKSTLFNSLMGRTAAVVSPVAGTTRDWVAGEIEAHGFPLRLIDTAGTHETVDSLERTAIDAGARAARAAHATILLLDGTAPMDLAQIGEWMLKLRNLAAPALLMPDSEHEADRRIVVAVNKTDTRAIDLSALGALCPNVVAIAALTGAGVEPLVEELLRSLGVPGGWNDRRPCLFTERQVKLVREYLPSLRRRLDANWLERDLIGSRSSCGSRD